MMRIGGLIVFALAYGSCMANEYAMVRNTQPVVDVIKRYNGVIRLFTRDLDAWDADPSTGTWRHVTPELLKTGSTERMVVGQDFVVRRLSHITDIGRIQIGAGHIIANPTSGGVSSLMRSTDQGRTFNLVLVGSDTLASTDVVRRTDDGVLFFLDRVGRAWRSNDTGATWVTFKLPVEIAPGGARELDMIKSNMGVIIDWNRGVHFTTNGWKSIITPMISKRPIRRTQPTMLDYFSWTRHLMMTTNMLYLIEGRDVYKTPTNDLLWERWDTVEAFNASDDRMTLAWYDTENRLWMAPAATMQPTLLSADCLQPQVLRVYSNMVISYRDDTGPVIYENGKTTTIRPYNADVPFEKPWITANGKGGTWGIEVVDRRSACFDLLYKDDKTKRWVLDTTLNLGPVNEMRVLAPDSIVFGTPSGKSLYQPSLRKCIPFPVRQPLNGFLSSPIMRFRALVAADDLDSTHIRWCEFRLKGANFFCGEIVDSSRFGIMSAVTDISIPATVLQELLGKVNNRGDDPLRADELSVTAEDLASFDRMLDTVFVFDAYFDALDLYKPPPAPEVQIEDCRTEFANIRSKINSTPPDTITQSILAWRHVPKDEFSRYEMEFENRSGNFMRLGVERSDNAHPPLMLPWKGESGKWTWHCWERGVTDLFIKAFPPESLPRLFVDMARTPWYLAAVASHLDGIHHGRWHRWSAGEITPGARR